MPGESKIEVSDPVARKTAELMEVSLQVIKQTVADNDHNKYTTL